LFLSFFQSISFTQHSYLKVGVFLFRKITYMFRCDLLPLNYNYISSVFVILWHLRHAFVTTFKFVPIPLSVN